MMSLKAAVAAPAVVEERTRALRERVFAHFSQKAMVEGVLDGYRSVLNGQTGNPVR